MVVIFGWGSGKAQDFGEVAPTRCPVCHNEVFLHHIRSDKTFSLYFIPLASYGTDEYLVCPICHNGLQVDSHQRPAVGRMHAATSAFRTGAMTLAAYQPMVDQFWRELGVDATGAQVLQPTSTVPAPPDTSTQADGTALTRRLESLGKLHADGVLTDEEFAAAKRRLLET